MAQVKKGERVKFNYALKLKDGKVYETNFGSAPLELTCVGKGKAIKGLESALIGMPWADQDRGRQAAEGYGQKDQALLWTLPATELPGGTASAADTEVSFPRRRRILLRSQGFQPEPPG